ncbi:MAG: hypothetical protein D6781_01570 [Verrucomicrobia bacterium]|nr:MAG: hypothetical protein D6781_01570 [Verrucomicrobiota bacterium]
MAGVYENAQVGKREDLSDVIANIDRKNTPLLSRIKVGKKLVRAVFDWQMESYPEPRTEGVVDGKDADAWEVITTRALAHNTAQKWWRLPRVSDFAEEVSDVAGVRSEMAKQTKDALVMLKRDIEKTLCLDSRDCQLDDGSKGYQTRALGTWIQTGAQSLYPVDERFRPPAAQIDSTAVASVTETTLSNIAKSIWDNAGAAMDLWCPIGSTLKQQISTFAAYQQSGVTDLRRVEGEANAVRMMVDIVANDFATFHFVLSPFLFGDTAHGDKRCYILDMNQLELRYNRRPRVKPIENKGGGPRAIVDAIAGLCVKNPLGLAKMVATS